LRVAAASTAGLARAFAGNGWFGFFHLRRVARNAAADQSRLVRDDKSASIGAGLANVRYAPGQTPQVHLRRRSRLVRA
jgi:hypothetical protein